MSALVALAACRAARAPAPPAAAPAAAAGAVDDAMRETTRLANAGQFREAVPIAERHVETTERAHGRQHPDTGVALMHLGIVCGRAGDRVRSEQILAEAVQILERQYGPDHPQVGLAVAAHAFSLMELDRFADAEGLYRRALAVLGRTLGPTHLEVARVHAHLGGLYLRTDRPRLAADELLGARAILERTGRVDGVEYGHVLADLGKTHKHLGEFGQAEPLLRRAVELALAGTPHPDAATFLNELGDVYLKTGRLDDAERALRESLAIRERAWGPTDPRIVVALNGLALVAQARGDSVQAQQLYGRALLIFGQHPEQAAPNDVVPVMTNLAVCYQARYDFANAARTYDVVLAIMAAAPPGRVRPEHAVHALNGRAQLYYVQGDLVSAAQLYDTSLTILRNVFGPEHFHVGEVLTNRGMIELARDRPAEARTLLQEAHRILRQALGEQNLTTAIALNNLATADATAGRFADATAGLQGALATIKKLLGQDHSTVAALSANIAAMRLAVGDVQSALAWQERANEIRDRNLPLALAQGHEAQRLQYIAVLNLDTSVTVSLHAMSAPADRRAMRLALTAVLRRRGRVLEAAAAGMRGARVRAAPEDHTALDRLAAVRARLGGLVLGPAAAQNPARYWDERSALEREVIRLEQGLPGPRPGNDVSVTIEAVQAVLPADAALIEIVAYQPFDATAGPRLRQWGPARYVAYVLRPTGPPSWAELGDAGIIDEAARAFRQALADPSRADAATVGRSLHDRILRPVLPLLGGARHMIVAPDGALGLVPFASLVGESGRYLLEDLEVSYLTSGRELLAAATPTRARQGSLVIANPDFGATRAETKATAGASGWRPAMVGHAPFGALPATDTEGKVIATLLGDATLLTGANATEGKLKAVHGPRILHLATHGFFEEDLTAPPKPTASGAPTAPPPVADLPWVRSGLVLAGANRRDGGEEDGLLTAGEVSVLDLWGTKLVGLSACDTGIGQATNHEGVFGLRRSVRVAGAESLLMTLWKVDDAATRDLMMAYYARLASGEGRSGALREAQLAFLRSNTQRSRPYFWASFILSGASGPLDDSR